MTKEEEKKISKLQFHFRDSESLTLAPIGITTGKPLFNNFLNNNKSKLCFY